LKLTVFSVLDSDPFFEKLPHLVRLECHILRKLNKRFRNLLPKERFAIYGFQVELFDDWRVESNPKNTREKADFAFHTPKGNRFFVSWGDLKDATKRFSSLQEHRDSSIKRLKTGQVSNVSVTESRGDQINGHPALFSHVIAEINQGMFSKRKDQREMWSAHFYCEDKSRYYIIYSLVGDSTEFQNMNSAFFELAKSTVCH
jgi:hypothetical protein